MSPSCCVAPVIRGLLVITCVAAMMSCHGLGCGPMTRAARASPDELRVMCFNIRYGTARDGDNAWPHRRSLVLKVIRDHRPDIIGLQEVLRFQLDELREALPLYAAVGVGRNDGKTSGEYSPLMYRADRWRLDEHGTFWFSQTPEVPNSKHWGNQIPRICTWSRLVDRRAPIAVYVYNLHLDHQSQRSRERSVVLLAQRIRGRRHREPFIVTGDFNAGEDNPAIRYLKGEPAPFDFDAPPLDPSVTVVDTFRSIHPDAKDVGTFNGFRVEPGRVKIDYVFVPPTIQVVGAEIVRDKPGGRYPSDHFPVTAVLRIQRDEPSHREGPPNQ